MEESVASCSGNQSEGWREIDWQISQTKIDTEAQIGPNVGRSQEAIEGKDGEATKEAGIQPEQTQGAKKGQKNKAKISTMIFVAFKLNDILYLKLISKSLYI